MQTIKNITAEIGEECRVDVDMLHDALTKLPAEIYLKLYHKMQVKVLGYPGFYGGCATIAEDEKTVEAEEDASDQISRLTEKLCCDTRQIKPEDM